MISAIIPVVKEAMLAVSSSPGASILGKVTVTTALGLAGAWLARRSRAAVRHALLTATFGVMLALPIASMVAPPVRIVVPGVEKIAPGLAKRTGKMLRVARPNPRVDVVQSAPRSIEVSLSAVLVTGWIAGYCLFLLPVAMGLWQVRRLRRSAAPWRDGQAVVMKLAREAGIRRPVEVLLDGAIPGPMTCGFAHPSIVLPEDARTWKEGDLNCALIHELEHVRRGDWAVHCIARMVCAAYWFHPLVWMAWRGLVLEAERSCDDAVLGRSEATAYADQLVGLARRLSTAAKSPLLAMANRADLAKRVGAVLDSGQRRGRAGAWPVALACSGAALLVVTISPLTVVAVAQSAGTPARFLADSNLVVVNVAVTDKDGRSLEGLSDKDFVLTEEGVAQTISIFEYQKPEYQKPADESVSSYYILGYYPTNQNSDGRYRRIEVVEKDGATARLRYRSGYRARAANDASTRMGYAYVDNIMDPDTTLPALIFKKEPEYSEEARKARYSGTVVLNVEVNESGLVNSIRVIKGVGLGLDEKAIEAVGRWRFNPALKGGKPVAVQTQVAVNFRLM